jgi:phage terminase small subunit
LIRAGYSPITAEMIGFENLKKPDIMLLVPFCLML